MRTHTSYPSRPRHPNGFFLFLRDFTETMKTRGSPNTKRQEITRGARDEWRSLPLPSRSEYESKARRLRDEEYSRRCESFIQSQSICEPPSIQFFNTSAIPVTIGLAENCEPEDSAQEQVPYLRPDRGDYPHLPGRRSSKGINIGLPIADYTSDNPFCPISEILGTIVDEREYRLRLSQR